MKRILLSGVATIVLPGMAFANCPAITVADMGGVAPGDDGCREQSRPGGPGQGRTTGDIGG